MYDQNLFCPIKQGQVKISENFAEFMHLMKLTDEPMIQSNQPTWFFSHGMELTPNWIFLLGPIALSQ